jgi:hypothetical protein
MLKSSAKSAHISQGPSEVLLYITSLDPGEASGPDGLSGRMLRGIANY